MKSLEFSNLPLTNVVVRTVFDRQIDFSFDQYCRIWADTRERFDTVEELERFENPPVGLLSIRPVAVNGICLHRKSIATSIQSVFVGARWEKAFSPMYPRYDALRECLWDALSAVKQATDGEVRISVVNMGYANIISRGGDIDAAARRYLRKETLPPLADQNQLNDLNVAWKESDGLECRIVLGQTQLQVPVFDPESNERTTQPQNAILLTTAGGAFITEGQDPIQVLDAVHSRLQTLFMEVTTEEARDEWGYVHDTTA